MEDCVEMTKFVPPPPKKTAKNSKDEEGTADDPEDVN